MYQSQVVSCPDELSSKVYTHTYSYVQIVGFIRYVSHCMEYTTLRYCQLEMEISAT